MQASLNEAGIYLSVQSDDVPAKTMRLSTLVRLLNDINRAWMGLIEVEFFKRPDFKNAWLRNNRVLDTIKDELELLVLWQKGNQLLLSPNLVEAQQGLFKDAVQEWKQETYLHFKEKVIYADYLDANYLKYVVSYYTQKDRLRIFQPLLAASGEGKNYRVLLHSATGKVQKALRFPADESVRFFVPKMTRPQQPKVEKTVLAYLRVREDEGKINPTKKKNIKGVYYYEELEHQTYPYRPDSLRVEEIVFVLRQALECQVYFEHGEYIIAYPEFDLRAAADDRTAAEEKFAFQFYLLYRQLMLAKPQGLSSLALKKKQSLQALVQQVVTDDDDA